MKKPGRKLLLTGNGRCNLTNADPALTKAFHSSGSGAGGKDGFPSPCREAGKAELFADAVIGPDGREQTLAFFSRIGLDTIDRQGYIYPRPEQSSALLQALLCELSRLGVKMHYDAKVTSLLFQTCRNTWSAAVDGGNYEGDAVILCCGSKAYPSTGSDGSGYALASSLGHTIAPVYPALTAICCPDPDLKLCAGACTRARVSLYRKAEPGRQDGYGIRADLLKQPDFIKASKAGQVLLLPPDLQSRSVLPAASETGEVQWTAGEISGIPAFQVSRYVSAPEERNGLLLNVDFLPEYEEVAAAQRLETLFRTYGKKRSLQSMLNGLVHERITAYLLRKAALPDNAHAAAPEKIAEIAQLVASLMKRMIFPMSGTRSFEQAQVCRGGVDLSQVCPDTLESRLCQGLYFAGELLDIDGPCGGYNLQWAWSSGMTAGRAAARGSLRNTDTNH